MPKERITKKVVPDYGDPMREDFDLNVNWVRDCHVQASIGMTNGVTLLWKIYGRPENRIKFGQEIFDEINRIANDQYHSLAALKKDRSTKAKDELDSFYQSMGSIILNMIEGTDIPQDGGNYEYHELYADLDRDACNEAIRVLRRARDQAYGRDE